MSNLAHILSDTAAAQPTAVAVRLDDIELSYGALDALSQRVGGLLRMKGVQPGERVALISPNIPQMPAIYYGILRYGAVVVPLNPMLKAREVKYHLQDSGATLVFAWERIAAEVEEGAAGSIEVIAVGAEFISVVASQEAVSAIAAAADDDTAVILYTSGTTGRPKGAELTHRNLRTNAQLSVDLFSIGREDVIFGGLPFFHVFGQTCALNAAVLAGATVTILPKFDPVKALQIVERDQVSIMLGVPTMYIAILRVPDRDAYDVSALRLAGCGGSPLPVEILHEFESSLDATLLEGYGLSETSPVVCFNQVDGIRKPGSIGTVVRGAQLRVLDDDDREAPAGDVGELAVAGEYVMKGYWNNPVATAEAIQDGWFRTGDLARMDEDKVFFIVDRKKDMILRGGYNVYPREVEEVLYAHPAVGEAAVIGVPDDVHGEEIVAVISLKPGTRSAAGGGSDSPDGQGSLEEQIGVFAQDRLAAYKYPRRIVIVEELPKGPTGKILKREIRA